MPPVTGIALRITSEAPSGRSAPAVAASSRAAFTAMFCSPTGTRWAWSPSTLTVTWPGSAQLASTSSKRETAWKTVDSVW